MRLRAWASVAAGITTCVLLWGHWWLFSLAVFVAVANVWSLGIISNYALRAEVHWRGGIREGMLAEGYSEADVAKRLRNVSVSINPDLVPDWLITVNLLLSVACFGFLITGIVLHVWG